MQKNEEDRSTNFGSEIILAKSPIGMEIIEAQVDFVCPPFKAMEKYHLTYELSITNSFKQNLTLNSIDLVDADFERSLVKNFDASYLQENFIYLGVNNSPDEIILEPGKKGVITLQISVDNAAQIPSTVFHRLHCAISTKDGSKVNLPFELALIEIPKQSILTIGLPLKKGKWFYTAESHKNSRFITQGKPSYAQRFAVDWAFIEDDGTFVRGAKNVNESYPTYGQEILAVSDGIVKDIINDFPDNTPEQIDIRITRESICGNYLILDIGENTNAVYGHFIPNSFKVSKGEKIKKGQVIGFLGNSGNSDGPHLHFHLETDSPMVLGGEGIPFYFEKFTQLKFYTFNEMDTIFSGEKLDLTDIKSVRRFNELPVHNGVIEFD